MAFGNIITGTQVENVINYFYRPRPSHGKSTMGGYARGKEWLAHMAYNEK